MWIGPISLVDGHAKTEQMSALPVDPLLWRRLTIMKDGKCTVLDLNRLGDDQGGHMGSFVNDQRRHSAFVRI
jgi:hypothetical protein